MQHQGRPTVSPGAKCLKARQRGVGVWARMELAKGGVGRGESDEFKREQSRWVMATVVRTVGGIFQFGQ